MDYNDWNCKSLKLIILGNSRENSYGKKVFLF